MQNDSTRSAESHALCRVPTCQLPIDDITFHTVEPTESPKPAMRPSTVISFTLREVPVGISYITRSIYRRAHTC